MVTGSAITCLSPKPVVSRFFFYALPPSCLSTRRCRFHIPCSLDFSLNRLLSMRVGGFKFQEDADADEYIGGGRFGGRRTREKRTWWTDGFAEAESDDEDYDFDDEEAESIWDKIWIFKVFKAYGYFLPAIIASMLLATGPKAFLMALALPLGQSALSMVFEKVVGKENGRARRPSGAKKWASSKPRYGSRSKVAEEEEKGGGLDSDYKDYKSWVAGDDVGVSGRKGAQQQPVSGYGGWDELDGREFRKARKPSAAGATPQAHAVKKERLTRRGRSKDMPLFWRMLVAVFPFLGTWTKFL